MKNLLFLLILVSTTAMAGTAFFSHETDTGGLTKQCHYKYLSEVYTITVRKTKLCPLTIKV